MDAGRQTSVTFAGSISGSGGTFDAELQYTSSGSNEVEAISGVGSEDMIRPSVLSYCLVKASSLDVLTQSLKVKKPTSAEIGIWYKVSKSDSRFDFIANPTGAQNIAQLFSYSPLGWSRTVTEDGTTEIHGMKVIKLIAGANIWVPGKGFGRVTLYVSEGAHPLPIAVSGPSGTSGLMYFDKWGSTTFQFPTTSATLPQ
jgi:hypothetical protein